MVKRSMERQSLNMGLRNHNLYRLVSEGEWYGAGFHPKTVKVNESERPKNNCSVLQVESHRESG